MVAIYEALLQIQRPWRACRTFDRLAHIEGDIDTKIDALIIEIL